MEVTRDNFEKLLPEILESIDNCTFLAIDCELSGLNVTDEKDNYFETVEERYDAVRRSSTQFLVVQFGLCPFFFNTETNEFSHHAYNFYTFPHQCNKDAPNIRFLCESSSLDFLASSGFDFNKWIYTGISYMTNANTEKMRETLEKRQIFRNSEEGCTISVPETLKNFMVNTNNRIKEFLSSSEKEITFTNITPYQRKLIFHNLKPKYSSKLYFETVIVDEYASEIEVADSSDGVGECVSLPSANSDSELTSGEEAPEDFVDCVDGESVEDVECIEVLQNEKIDEPESAIATDSSPELMKSLTEPTRNSKIRVLRIVKLNQAEQNIEDEKKRRIELDKVDQGVGFSKVIHKITESGKVVVGHNMLLDIAHTVHQFVEELPEGLAEFKTLVQTVFPNLIDTKYMSSSHPFRELISSTVLFDLVKRLRQDPFRIPGAFYWNLNVRYVSIHSSRAIRKRNSSPVESHIHDPDTEITKLDV